MNATTEAVHEAPAEAPRDFRERVMALAGGTTFREPMGGRGTKADQMPAAHAVAAALGMARQGPDDIGPDIALCIALGVDHRRGLIVVALANEMRRSDHRIARNNRDHIGYIVNCAFDRLVHPNLHRPKVDTIPQAAWDTLLPAACRILEALADAAVAEAEQKWRRA